MLAAQAMALGALHRSQKQYLPLVSRSNMSWPDTNSTLRQVTQERAFCGSGGGGGAEQLKD
jgi:hypothetical protein